MKRNQSIIPFMLNAVIILLLTVSACKKDKKPEVDPPVAEEPPVTDIDGNVYQTVKIGNKVWMAENLRTLHYRNGDLISTVTGNDQWVALAAGACCSYNNDPQTNATVYGRLYNWYAVNDNRGIAPAGWHVATEADWNDLITALGGDAVAGGKLKEAGTTHWLAPNTGADNSSGFAARPGGYRDANDDGWFYTLTSYGYWWLSEEVSSSDAQFHRLDYDAANLVNNNASKHFGLSVRCVRD